jgi:hypothetical protein
MFPHVHDLDYWLTVRMQDLLVFIRRWFHHKGELDTYVNNYHKQNGMSIWDENAIVKNFNSLQQILHPNCESVVKIVDVGEHYMPCIILYKTIIKH